MRYAGGLVRHLGLQMYAGAVPSIAELVANAWDADAANVWIEIPLDQPFVGASEIRVRDDGTGMTFDEANDLYLVIGRESTCQRDHYTSGSRPVMGRKRAGEARRVRRRLCGRSVDRQGRLADGVPHGLRTDREGDRCAADIDKALRTRGAPRQASKGR